MTILSIQDIKQLADPSQVGWHVSLYLPTHPIGAAWQQDPIRLKNLLAEAQEMLERDSVRSPDALDLLRPAAELVEDRDFWKHQNDGLALFITQGRLQLYRLPLDFEPLAQVGDRFHLKPLLPLLSHDGQFYLLALSQDEVRLFHGSKYRLGEIQVDDMPDGVRDVLKYEDPEKHVGFHTSTAEPSSHGQRPAAYHGHGAKEQDSKDLILRYFQKVNRVVSDWFINVELPLVIAGLDHLVAIYREVNSYPKLMPESVLGNPDDMSHAELHERAWRIVRPFFDQDRQQALNDYAQHDGVGDGQASHDLRQIITAAHRGRIDTLFLAQGEHRWGRYDAQHNAVDLHLERQHGDQDLLDLVATQTLLNGGTVYVMPIESFPETGEPLAAVYRY